VRGIKEREKKEGRRGKEGTGKEEEGTGEAVLLKNARVDSSACRLLISFK